MNLTNLVVEEIEKGNICVLPTEVAARFYRIESATKLKSRMVFSNQILAFDEFKARFLPIKKEKPVNKVIRKIFLRDLLDKKGLESLEYFSNGKYKESFNTTVNYLTKIITEFGYLEEDHFKYLDPLMVKDINFIKNEYTSFLKERGLYEPGFEKPSYNYYKLKGFEKNNYSILFPEGIEELPLFLQKLGTLDWIKVIDLMDSSSKEVGTELEVFDNSLIEIRACLRRIALLTKQKVPIENIIITVAKLNEYKTYLQEEAKDKGIVLNFIENKKLNEYLPGKFFTGIKELFEQDYSMESVSQFLLNYNFPYKDIETNREIVKLGIKGRIEFGKDNWKKVLGGKTLSYFNKLINLINGLYRARTVLDLKKLINTFQQEMFVEGAFKQEGLEKEADIYSFCVNQLEVLDHAMKEAGYDSFDNLYSLYYEMLETTSYVEQIKEKGIRVFNYPVTLGIRPEYHFILGVNQEAIKQHNQYLSFLSQEKLSSLEQLKDAPLLFKKKDFTDRVLKSYSFSGEKVFLSYSKKTFSSSVICPSLFQEERIKKDFDQNGDFGFKNDKRQEEKQFWVEGKPFVPSVRQSKGFESYSILNFGEKKENTFSWIDEVNGLKTEDGKWKLSATEINTFRECPFKWLCKYGFRTPNDDFNVLDEDYAEIGNFYHKVFESFFEEIKVFEIDNIESYREKLNDIYLKELKTYEKRVKIPESTLIYEKVNFDSSINGFLESREVPRWEDKEFKGKEVSLDAFNDKWALNGKIDLILSDENGDLGVIDFKRSDSSSIKNTKFDDEKQSSVQLLVYNRLMEKDLSFSAFYVVNANKFKFCFENPNDGKASRKILETIIDEMLEKIEKGQLEPTVSEDSCKNCSYKKVCRKKFVIR